MLASVRGSFCVLFITQIKPFFLWTKNSYQSFFTIPQQVTSHNRGGNCPNSAMKQRYLFILCIAALVHAQDGLTGFNITFQNSVLMFPEMAMKKFYDCLCFSQGECTFRYNRYADHTSDYRVLNVQDYTLADASSQDFHYICDRFEASVLESGEDIYCAYATFKTDKCNQADCSIKSFLSNLHDDCPCISIQWENHGTAINYSGECKPTENKCPEQSTSNTRCSLQRPTTQTTIPHDPDNDPPPNTSQEPDRQDNEDSDESSDNQAVAIGAGLGSALAIVIIIAAVGFYILWQRKKQAGQNHNKQPGTQPNFYVKSRISTNSDISHEYTDYVEPGSTYYEIGEDGELAACRDEALNTRNISPETEVVKEADDKIGSDGDGYNKLNAKKDASSNILATYDRAAGGLDDDVIGKLRISDETSADRTEGEELSSSVTGPIEDDLTTSGDEHVTSAAASVLNQGNDYFTLESVEDEDEADDVKEIPVNVLKIASHPTGDYFGSESVEDKKGENYA